MFQLTLFECCVMRLHISCLETCSLFLSSIISLCVFVCVRVCCISFATRNHCLCWKRKKIKTLKWKKSESGWAPNGIPFFSVFNFCHYNYYDDCYLYSWNHWLDTFRFLMHNPNCTLNDQSNHRETKRHIVQLKMRDKKENQQQ